jgi:predicted enzyme related to lactoylglutathione lyase
MAQGEFRWLELYSADDEETLRFYESVLGWSIETHPVGSRPYHFVQDSGDVRAGIVRPKNPSERPRWTPFVEVDDLDAACKRCEESGGRILIPPTPVPSFGAFARLEDPSGAEIGIFVPS